MRFDPGVAQTARRVAHAIINDMHSGDLGAVLFSYLGRSTGLTADRAVLHAAVESLIPHPDPVACGPRGGCEVASIFGVTENLAALGTSRKLLFLIGSSRRLVTPDSPFASIKLKELFERLHRYNWVVYAVEPEGVQTLASTAESRSPTRTTIVQNDSLRAFSESTGGRVVSSNDSWMSVRALFDENEAVYTLGFRPGRPMDGKFHRVRVEVRVPGAVVRAPRGYFARGSLTSETAPRPSLETALSGPLPLDGIRLELLAVPVALDPGVPEIVVVGRALPNTGPDAETPEDFVVSALRLPDYAVERTFKGKWPSRTVTGEVVLRLKVRPGMYEVRLGASTETDMGTVFATIDVPNFDDEPLSMSGLMFHVPREGVVADDGVPDVAALMPTAVRSFPVGSRFRGLVTVYQGRRDPEDVVVECVVTDERGEAVRRKAEIFTATDFKSRGFASVVADPESPSLPEGRYRLSITARSGEVTVERASHFNVAR
jgi:hypothetical protein